MNAETVRTLCELNNSFYQRHGDSFSATRGAPWEGWQKSLAVLSDALAGEKLSVFDLACGNLRFAAFLMDALPQMSIDFYAVDNCDDMVPQLPSVSYQSLDVLDVLQGDSCINARLRAPICDLSVAFGFMHHVPMQRLRGAVLEALIRQTRAGGQIIVSFWQFMKHKTLADKARTAHERATEELGLPQLDAGDYLLDWQGKADAYRYCHSFEEGEIDELVASVAGRAIPLARFSADGRSGDLNSYLILRVL